MSRRLETIDIGNHNIAIYPDHASKLDEAFAFLKQGLQNGEAVMLITEDISKDEIRSRMAKEWGGGIDVAELEARGEIIIKTAQEWYFPKGSVDGRRISSLWAALAELTAFRGKRGLRVFGDVSSFFSNGHASQLVRYECELEKQFSIPVTALCAYVASDFGSLTGEQAKNVESHHHAVWD